jgi:hypothetical protein
VRQCSHALACLEFSQREKREIAGPFRLRQRYSEKADLIAEVTSYDAGGISLGGNPIYTADGKPVSSTGARKDLSPASVTLKVYDAKSRRELWSGTEKVKAAFKKKAEEDNAVASAEKLFLRFHDFVQPPGK